MNKNRQLLINMTAQIIGFIVSTCISFFLTSYIVDTVGTDAYGFVTLGNNFVSYAQLVTIALNSMASRFITIKIHKKDNEGANKYFTSIVIANIFLALVSVVIGLFVVVFINKFINISDGILIDVKLLWLFIFINFAISLIGGTYGVATFAMNRLDLTSIRSIQSSILKGVLLFFAYNFFTAKVWYIGATSLICTTYILFWDVHYTKKLLPDVKVKKEYFDIKVIIEVISSGIWNTITRLGQLLSTGLDLLITNIFIGATPMGVLSIAKTVPTLVGNVNGMLANVFAPNITIEYAKGNKEEILKVINKSAKFMGLVVTIPISLQIAYGQEFYMLWVPKENYNTLYILSIMTVLFQIVECSIMSVYYVFTAVNKVKLNSISVIVQGILNAIIVLILLNTTNWGIYAVASVSSILTIMRIIFFSAPYAAKIIGFRWFEFFFNIAKSIFAVIILSVVGFLIKYLVPVYSWTSLIISGGIAGIVTLIINIFIFLSKSDRAYIIECIKKVVKR